MPLFTLCRTSTRANSVSMFRAFICLFVFMLPAAVSAQDVGTLPAGVKIVTSGYDLPADSYSLLVQEVGADAPLLAINAALPLNPASSIKTLTTLAALEVLGPSYTWHTEIHPLGTIADGTLDGDLLLKGGGDPFLVEDYFRNMLKTLQRRGVTRISGDLVIDESLFDPSVSMEPMIDNDTNRSYNVLPHALMVNFQTVNFFFYPHGNGREVVIKADPELPNLNIVNQLRLENRSCDGFQRGVSFREDPADASGVVFAGNYPSRCVEFVLQRAVLDAPTYAYGLFRKLWQELGGEFAGELRMGTTPVDHEALVVWESEPLTDVIKSINKYSNNMMTRQLLLTMAVEKYGTPATVENGVRAVQDYLAALGIDHAALVLGNGSGLARDTRITANLFNDVLQRGFGINTMPEFLASLPLSGEDGTMRNRLRNGDTRGSMHVKTGSLDAVASVAGYVHARSGRHFVVVSMLNTPQADAGPGRELADALLAWAYEQ
jgi:D-alanyl-D-alanine carboxypeptidase/D-alanyl-D-alanine-endopeptidase (penicillin-binding protein 4)